MIHCYRRKAEILLTSWLNTYDEDIGEKQAEYDEIMTAFDEEKKRMQDLQDQFAAQDVEYWRLMKEKEDEEKAILEKKLSTFICNRSAKRIQRYWRAYRARKLARRKGRKKKKGSAAKKK
ncbi:hypothetical protein L9F63_012054 [Diploptera punctata]|uniref:Dynein regulatory complex protein 10 n=1 Tax=Diploptera punctata TaxID=6984 RepID=A0AAD8ADE2_DIPPU|nr:hypothetical protein L9F63_012054 [Diploptera punctata]